MPHARAHTRRHEQLTRANCRGRSTKRTHNRVIQIPCSGRAACGTGKLKLRLQRRKAQRANWEGKFQAIEINGIRVAKLTYDHYYAVFYLDTALSHYMPQRN